uniref:Uncharacterized protein n=1 Tax=Arundo donax TaxID=35708 RepID=A0A0A8Z3R8_ARUDO
MSMGRRPTESETGPEKVVMTVAPMREVATTRPSMAGWLSSWNSRFM